MEKTSKIPQILVILTTNNGQYLTCLLRLFFWFNRVLFYKPSIIAIATLLGGGLVSQTTVLIDSINYRAIIFPNAKTSQTNNESAQIHYLSYRKKDTTTA